jgi:hypothetical protein
MIHLPWHKRGRKIETKHQLSYDNKRSKSDKNQSIGYDDYEDDAKTIRTRIITDEPTLEDALDFESYSNELADIIRNSTPRLSIGVFGEWGTGKTTLMKMIEANLLKGSYVFEWENIPEINADNSKLKSYLKENISNLEWIYGKNFFKSEDGKTINIRSNDKKRNNSLSISIDKKAVSISLSVNGRAFSNQFIMKKEEDNDGNVRLNIYKRKKDILTVWFNAKLIIKNNPTYSP